MDRKQINKPMLIDMCEKIIPPEVPEETRALASKQAQEVIDESIRAGVIDKEILHALIKHQLCMAFDLGRRKTRWDLIQEMRSNIKVVREGAFTYRVFLGEGPEHIVEFTTR